MAYGLLFKSSTGFFFNDTATTEIYTLSLHDALPIFFYQVFDKGVREDGEGRQIDFKNPILVLTTNAGTDTLMKLCADPETMPEAEGLVKALKPELNKIFKPAFLGRTVIIPYSPIRDEAMKRIIRLKLGKV